MIRKEIIIFIIVGSLTVLIDYFTYRGLVWIQLLGVDLAKSIGFLTGTAFAYFANRFWTFSHHTHAPGSAWRFIVVYTITLGANVAVNAIALVFFFGVVSVVQLAFLLATATSAILNFLGMKFFVFRETTVAELP